MSQASNTSCRFASIEEAALATPLVATSPGTLLPLERMPRGTPSTSLGRAGYDGVAYAPMSPMGHSPMSPMAPPLPPMWVNMANGGAVGGAPPIAAPPPARP